MNNVVARFAKFLEGCWKEAPVHSYHLPARGRLSGWRNFNSQWDGDREIWTVRSLSEALEKYFWPLSGRACGRELAEAGAGDFASNREELEKLRESLSKAMQARDNQFAERVVYKVFEWGGVSPRRDGTTRSWVAQQARIGALCSELARAVQLLNRTDAPLDAFRTRSLPMNSSMTKVYALADPQQCLIIYDGRVGAALGHLARLYLEQGRERIVPEELRF